MSQLPFKTYAGDWHGWPFAVIVSISAGLKIKWLTEDGKEPPEEAIRLFKGGVELWLQNPKYAGMHLEEFLQRTITCDLYA